jgi:predicted nucleic acid-binding protein
MKIFLDTSALIALYNADDANHTSARTTMDAIRDGGIPFTRFYTTDYVVDEVLTYISCVIGDHGLAVRVGEALLTSPFTTLLRVDADLFQKAWEIFKGHEGLSFTDCASFQAMRDSGLVQAFSYDGHFKAAGFSIING